VYELPGRDLHRVRHLFDAEHLGLVIEAMVAGNSPARAWVDDGANPRAVAIWDGAHSLYIAGTADRASVFSTVISGHVAPARPGLVEILLGLRDPSRIDRRQPRHYGRR
jgi:hypothetical protein